MVIGIVAAIFGFIPFCGSFAIIPAIVGLVLGIVDLLQKKKKKLPKGMPIAGIALNGAAICIILLYSMLFMSAAADVANEAAKASDALRAQSQRGF